MGGAGRLGAAARAGATAATLGDGAGGAAWLMDCAGAAFAVGASDGRGAGVAAAGVPLVRATALGDGRPAAAAGWGAGLTFFGVGAAVSVGSGVGAGVALMRSITAWATDGPAATPVTAVATTTVVPIRTNPIGPFKNAASSSAFIYSRNRPGPDAAVVRPCQLGPFRFARLADGTDRD